MFHSSSPQVEAEFWVIISGFLVHLGVERDKKSPKILGLRSISLILQEIISLTSRRRHGTERG
jgi:hypothetical protein